MHHFEVVASFFSRKEVKSERGKNERKKERKKKTERKKERINEKNAWGYKETKRQRERKLN